MKTETTEVNDIEMNEANAINDIDANVACVEAAIAAEDAADRRAASAGKSKLARKRGRKPLKEATTQFTFRIPAAWVERADRIGEGLSRPGLEISRTDAVRAALAMGLDALEREKRR